MREALQLLVTLTGVTLLFGCAQANGTMEGAARQALRLCGTRTALLPLMFFALAALLAMIGPGAILATALVAPFAMNSGVRAGIPPILIALMVANGANAGNLSPFSTVGAIVSGLMTNAGLGGHAFRVWFFHAAAHILAAAAAFVLFGGLSLRQHRSAHEPGGRPPFQLVHAVTLGVTAAWILCVVFLRWPLGISAFGAAAILFALRCASPKGAAKRMPWKTIALVVTISTTVGLLERAGALAWFQDLITRLATPRSVHAVLAALTGLISAYSSTSGVVLPAFLPLAAGLAARLPGTDPLALAITINIGSALVDVSPLSTLGALCIAAAPPGADIPRLYRNLLLWGFAMVPLGAALCYFISPLFLV